MRIPSGKTDQLIFFVAVDVNDLTTRKTGLTSFTVYRSRNGGTATLYTTPTVAELSAANMPGVYALTVDEDTTIASGSDSEEYCVHITQASMAPVTRTVELYRRDTTSGKTLTVDSNNRADAAVGAVANGVIVAASFAANALDAVWSTATRLLTAGTNIVLANGTGVTGFNDLDAAGVRTAVGLGSANLDTQLSAINNKTTNLPSDPADASDIVGSFATVAGAISAVDTKLGTPAGASVSADIAAISVEVDATGFADALLDRADAIETGLTLRGSHRLLSAVLGGKVSGAGSGTEVFRNAVADSKARVTATVSADGSRTAIITDLT